MGHPVDGAPGVTDQGDRPAVPTPGPGWGPFPPHPFLSLQWRPPLRGPEALRTPVLPFDPRWVRGFVPSPGAAVPGQ